jgi:hypothetical protein
VHDRVAALEGRTERELVRDVEALEAEAGVVEARREVGHRAVGEIVDADDLVPLGEQALAEMGADEAGRPSYADSLHLSSSSFRMPVAAVNDCELRG